MGINWNGFGIAYQAGQEELRRQAEDERRAAAAAEAQKDAAYREEARNRQRGEWKEIDRVKAADKADREAINTEADEAARARDASIVAATAQETAKATADAIAEQAAAGAQPAPIDGSLVGASDAQSSSMAGSIARGIAAPAPQSAQPAPGKLGALSLRAPQNFNDTLSRNLEFLRRKNARGDLAPEEYAEKSNLLKRMQKEGIGEAVTLMAQGRFDEAMTAYNEAGAMKGATVLKAEAGTTKINGEDMPTNFVTIRNADGTRTTMDTAKAQYQLLAFSDQLAHADRARTTQDRRDQDKWQRGFSEKQYNAQRQEAAQARALQWAQFNRERENTPSGKIAAIEKALGRKLTPQERAEKLGFDTLPQATRAQLNSYLKQQDQISAAMNKAQAEGAWDPASPGSREMMTRDAELSVRIAQLLAKGTENAPPADPAGLFAAPAPATPAANAAPAAAAPAQRATPTRSPIAAPGGVRPQPQAQRGVSQILASSDPAYQRLMAPKAAAIEAAAAEFKAANAEYVQVARGGDPKANAAFLPRVQNARAALERALDEAGASKNPDVLRAVGMM